jgi:hypothetical protein
MIMMCLKNEFLHMAVGKRLQQPVENVKRCSGLKKIVCRFFCASVTGDEASTVPLMRIQAGGILADAAGYCFSLNRTYCR